MDMPYGSHEARIYYVQETNYGETPSNPSMIGVSPESVEPYVDPGLIKIRGIGSRDLQTIRRGVRQASLKIGYPLPSDSPTDLLQHVQTLNSLSVEIFYEKTSGLIDLLFKGCRIDKASVECSVEDVVKANVELAAQNAEASSQKLPNATYASYGGAVPYYESYVQRGAADGSNPAAVDRVTDWKFTVENNLSRVPVIRSTDGHLLKHLPARQRGLSGELVFEFESREEFDYVVNDIEFSLKFGLGGPKSALFKYCKWEAVVVPTKIEDLVSLKASFVARDLVIS